MQRQGRIPANVNLKKIKTCSKMMAIAAHLAGRRLNGRRKIVFCHYRGEIDLLKALLVSKGITCQSVDGRAGRRERKLAMAYAVTRNAFQSVCKKWNDQGDWFFGNVDQFLAPQVLIVQIQTACEGLNLQHFQEVYFTSPHWNPAVESQAIARSHRIGQREVVNVWRFLMEDFNACTCGDRNCKKEAAITIDTYCQMVQDRKRELIKLLDP